MTNHWRQRLIVCALAAWIVAPASTARGWFFFEDGPYNDKPGSLDIALSLAIDPAGNVIAGGTLEYGPNGHPYYGVEPVVVKLHGTQGTKLWQTNFGNGGYYAEVATDAAGAVFVAVPLSAGSPTPPELFLRVAKLDGGTGAVVWQTDVVSTGVSVPTGQGKRIVPHAIVVDASGDLVVAADDPGVSISPPVDTSAPFRVLKFSGTTGAVLWDASAPEGLVRDLALLGHDVVVAAKRTTGLDQGIVMRLSSATGTAVWSHDAPGLNSDATSIAVDSIGNVVFAGRNPEVVAKLARNTGNEIWSSPLPAGHYANYRGKSVRIDSADDVVVAGRDDPNVFVGKPFVLKLSGASGGQLWLKGPVSSSSGPTNFAFALDGSDNVLWATQAPGGLVRLAKLAAATGTTLWSKPIAGIPAGGLPAAVIVTPSEDPVVAGQLGGGHSFDFAVFRLSGHDGSCFGPHCVFHLTGGLIKGFEKSNRKWLMAIHASGNPALPVPPPLTASDPTDAGAVLTLFNPTTMEYATFVLPPGANWRRLGPTRAPGSKGYIYQDKLQADGPCTMLKMVPGKTLTAICSTKGATEPFSFDEPTQGTLAVLLQIGEFEYCLTSDGGTVAKDQGVQDRKPALFKATNAPAPDTCPLLAR